MLTWLKHLGHRGKHPARETSGTNSSNTSVPTMEPLIVEDSDIYKAIMSFPSGSAGGYTGIRPQHLKEMVNPVIGEIAETLLSEITRFVNNSLAGLIPDEIRPFFFGATLCALKKKDGGIRPIAVGNTLRRLVSKAAVRSIRAQAAMMLQPNQLGFGVSQGSEAAVHATRAYINNLPEDNAVVKLDFKNAFNLLKRDVVLAAVQEHFPGLFPFVLAGYSKESMLLFGEHEITSSEGVQQGDPLAPFLFCIAVREITVRLTSELNIWFLDDGTLAGTKESLLHDLTQVMTRGQEMGLVLNPSKCEIISVSQQVINAVRSKLPGAAVIAPTNSVLLGAPLGSNATDTILRKKLEELRRMEQRIGNLDTHDALYLLTKCLSLLRLTYFLRCAPSYDNPILHEYDSILRQIFTKVLNLTLEDGQWNQATLPVRLGGIGVRKSSQIALPAFLSSCIASRELVAAILPEHLRDKIGVQDQKFIDGAMIWDNLTGSETRPAPPNNYKQSHWDGPIVENIASTMLQSVSGKDRARLLAVRAPHAGDFLLAVPNSSLGTRIDPQTIRIGVALRLAAPILAEHRCICGSEAADRFGYHGLVCRKSEGKIARHEEVNNIIKRSLTTAGCPAVREPPQLCRSDGSQKRPDGITLQAWTDGKQVVWDYTCASTLADTYLQYTREEGGAAASFRESQKSRKYGELAHHYMFVPIGSETLGSWGKSASKFLKELGKRLIRVTRDPRAASFLFQRLSAAVQRGNACCILGTRPSSEELDEIFAL
ncbi:hypothetical protein OTU49_013221 [Cherax quadricarinatus]|uniref:Reverse transcriptase domain-containing protein n=1 Tax=Cherax quadricarinatus TaxID=27406 RepID=A0AAW0VUY0_CHEQU